MEPDTDLFYGQALEVHFADPWNGGDPMQEGTYRGYKDKGGAYKWDAETITIRSFDSYQATYRWDELRYIIKYDNRAEWALIEEEEATNGQDDGPESPL